MFGVLAAEERAAARSGEQAAKILQQALGIETNEVVNYCFPQQWPNDRERRARIIGEWSQTEARFLA